MRKNAIYMAIYQILILFLPFITLPYVSRVLGAEGIGIYSYTFSIVSYFMLISLLGIQLYGKREIAKVNHNFIERSKVFIEIFSIQIFMSIVSSILYFIYISKGIKEYRIIFLLQYLNLLSCFFDISWFYFGMEKFKVCVTRNLIVKISSLISIFIFVRDRNDIYIYTIILSISALLGQIIMWIQLNKHINFAIPNINNVLKRFIPILKLFIPVIAIKVFSVVDKTMLGFLSTINQVGLYENAEKISRVPISIITSLGVVMLPRITNLIQNNKNEEGIKYIEKSLTFTMFAACACSFGIYGISDIFIPLFLGQEFIQVVQIVKVLSIIILVISWGNVFRTQYILPNGMDGLYTKSVVYACICNIIINFILIPKLGAIGAAIASILSELVICIYQCTLIRREFRINKYLLSSCKYLISGLVMVIVVKLSTIFLTVSFLSILILILIGGITYIGSVVVLEVILNQKFIVVEIKRYLKLLIKFQ